MTGESGRSIRHRSVGSIVLTVIFALLAANAWVQVALVPLGESRDPATLMVLQLLVGATAAATAFASWVGARWGPLAALAYGLVTAGMIVSLQHILDLGPDTATGLWTGGAMVVLFALVTAWYLRREVARRDAMATRDLAQV